VNNLKIKKGNFIGLNDDSIQVAHTNKIETTKHLLQNLIDKDKDEILTIFYGKDMSETEKLEISTYLENNFEEIKEKFHEDTKKYYQHTKYQSIITVKVDGIDNNAVLFNGEFAKNQKTAQTDVTLTGQCDVHRLKIKASK